MVFIKKMETKMAKKTREKKIPIEMPKDISISALTLMDVADSLRSDIIGFVNDWLWVRNMKVIDDDPGEEAVTTSGATMKGSGNVRLNFYFKKAKEMIPPPDPAGSPEITQDW